MKGHDMTFNTCVYMCDVLWCKINENPIFVIKKKYGNGWNTASIVHEMWHHVRYCTCCRCICRCICIYETYIIYIYLHASLMNRDQHQGLFLPSDTGVLQLCSTSPLEDKPWGPVSNFASAYTMKTCRIPLGFWSSMRIGTVTLL